MSACLHLSHARALKRRQFFCQTDPSLGTVALDGLLSRCGNVHAGSSYGESGRFSV